MYRILRGELNYRYIPVCEKVYNKLILNDVFVQAKVQGKCTRFIALYPPK